MGRHRRPADPPPWRGGVVVAGRRAAGRPLSGSRGGRRGAGRGLRAGWRTARLAGRRDPAHAVLCLADAHPTT
ncbi:hypothetical protein G6F24_017956 [Rhizopus arrhizus]|nr:hypothetical protein G6F24_017956 [Rhizopus arrhizus]